LSVLGDNLSGRALLNPLIRKEFVLLDPILQCLRGSSRISRAARLDLTTQESQCT